MAQVYTPLRYPGGKSQIAPVFKQIFERNNLEGSHYVEPYAGGAGVALALLLTEYARHIHLNDVYYPIYCFWYSILNDTESFCRKIADTPADIETWKEQREIVRDFNNYELEDVGFAFFFLNRANRSGITTGGVIGGLDQTGNYKIDARLNRKELIKKVEVIASYKHRISVYHLDAKKFLLKTLPKLPKKSFVYLDPPYYCKGGALYLNAYKHKDHEDIASVVQNKIKHKWIVTYDNHPVISKLYDQRRKSAFSLTYSAANYKKGEELMIYCDTLPAVDFPTQNRLPFS